MSIGKNIKKARLEKKITQKELARLIEKSERMIQKYEKDEVEPSIDILQLIGKALDINYINFLQNDDYYVFSSNNDEGLKVRKHITFSKNLIEDLLICISKEDEFFGYFIKEDDYNVIIDSLKVYLKNTVQIISHKNFEMLDEQKILGEK